MEREIKGTNNIASKRAAVGKRQRESRYNFIRVSSASYLREITVVPALRRRRS